MENRKYNGFTLIELLVVMAIIGILIALAIVGFNAARSAQRDTSRKDIVAQLNAMLQTYQSQSGSYPSVSNFSSFISSTTNNCSTQGNSNNDGITVNGTCVGLDGLSYNSIVSCGSTRPVSFNANDLNLCYDTTGGSNGYQMGVFLEGSTASYYVAN